MFTVKIDTDNDAFQEGDEDSYHAPCDEICRLLRELADRLEGGMVETTPLYDSNGNCVGHGIYKAD